MIRPVKNLSIPRYLKEVVTDGNIGDNLIIYHFLYSDKVKRAVDFLPARLQDYNMILLTRGDMTIDVGHKVYELHPGDVLEMESNVIIKGISMSEDVEAFHILVDEVYLNTILTAITPMTNNKSIRYRFKRPIQHIDDAQLPEILTAIDLLLNICNAPAETRKIQKAAVLFSFIFLIICGNDEEAKELSGDLPFTIDIAERFRILVQKHFREHHKVQFYASTLNVTPDYLTKVVKEHTGRTSSEWISKALLAEALVLLRRPEYSVGRVAAELKFFDQTAFGKFFKKETGISPLAYRKGKEVFK